jgi:hypothetical protein
VFTATTDISATYDAYEKDIARVSFYFEESTAFEYTRIVKKMHCTLTNINVIVIFNKLHQTCKQCKTRTELFGDQFQ